MLFCEILISTTFTAIIYSESLMLQIFLIQFYTAAMECNFLLEISMQRKTCECEVNNATKNQ